MNTNWSALAVEAVRVSKYAYQPYSKFAVGCAVLGADGVVYSGCNVENVSYGLSNCAERGAVFAMVAHGCRKIVAVVIYTPTWSATTPCGACRQVIVEFGEACEIRSVCDSSDTKSWMASALLPEAFDSAAAPNM